MVTSISNYYHTSKAVITTQSTYQNIWYRMMGKISVSYFIRLCAHYDIESSIRTWIPGLSSVHILDGLPQSVSDQV